MKKAVNVTLISRKPIYDIESSDKITFDLSEDESTLKISTVCFEGAKSSENLIILRKDESNKCLFDALIMMSQKVLTS